MKTSMNYALTLLMLLVLGMVTSLAQEEAISFERPTIAPVSPEAGNLGQYGQIPLNLSTGRMSYSVPLHTLTAHDYSWPITLNYSFGGLILEAKPSIAGLGWLIPSGGVVTREIRGIPDNHPDLGFYGINNPNATVVNNVVNGQAISYSLASDVDSGQLDSELDVYNVNVGNISFSFKIDHNNNPVYLSKHNYQVSFPAPTNTYHMITGYGQTYLGNEITNFTVKDDSGIIYKFEDLEVNVPQVEPDLVYSDGGFGGYYSAWQLTQVLFPNGKTLTFNYTDDLYYSIDYNASGYKNIGYPVVIDPGTCSQLQQNPYGYNESIRQTLIARKLLNNITAPSGSVDFNITTVNNRKLYDQIYVKDHTGSIINTYDFTYDHDQRDTLLKINKNSLFFYEFEYFGGVPDFIDGIYHKPTDQDHWGFYNSMGNQHMLDIPGTPIDANKWPNLFGSRSGGLNKIIYPTGGYSEVTYEQNQVKKPNNGGGNMFPGFNKELYLKVAATPTTLLADRVATFTMTFTEETRAVLSHSIIGDINGNHITMQVSTTALPNSSIYPNGYASNLQSYSQTINNAAQVMEDSGDLYQGIPPVPVSFFMELGPESCQYYGTANDYGCISDFEVDQSDMSPHFFINPGTYTFTINIPTMLQGELFADVRLRYYEAPEEVIQSPYINYNTGGVRVARIRNVDTDGTTSIKNYQYNDTDGFSSGVMLRDGESTYDVEVLYDCTIGAYGDNTNYRYLFNKTMYSSRYYNPVNINSGVPVYYTRVVTYDAIEVPGSENTDGVIEGILNIKPEALTGGGTATGSQEYYTNGYTVTHFELPGIAYTAPQYPFTPQRDDLSKGRVNKEEVYEFEESGSEYNIEALTLTDYISETLPQSVLNGYPWNVKIAKKREHVSAGDGVGGFVDQSGGIAPPDASGSNNHDYFHMVTYRENHINFKDQKVTTLTYFDDGSSVSDYTEKTYDSYGQIKDIITESSDNKPLRKTFYYPYDLTGITYQNMVSANHISKPGKMETYYNNQLTGTQTVNYVQLANDFKKKDVETAKGNSTDMDERIHYSYFSNGNIKEITQKPPVASPDASEYYVTTYIWGYNNQYPVAKIDHAFYDTAINLLTVSETQLQNLNGAALRDQLHLIRQGLPNAQVTTYTYDPLIGVTSITDPRGYTIYYEYDDQHRLKRVKDKDGNILSENTYNLRTQNP